VQQIRALQTPPTDSIAVDALLAKLRDLVNERVQLGFPTKQETKAYKKNSLLSVKEVLHYLDSVDDPDQLADLVSCALIPGASERQTILETVDLEPRLKHLIHFLIADIKEQRKGK
jgi:ATP-dependent Lon protease